MLPRSKRRRHDEWPFQGPRWGLGHLVLSMGSDFVSGNACHDRDDGKSLSERFTGSRH